jgi:predicted small lipoprotein YifL
MFAACGVLAACGQKGPLYLPQETPPSASGQHSHGTDTSGQSNAQTEAEKQKRKAAEQGEENTESGIEEPSVEK